MPDPLRHGELCVLQIQTNQDDGMGGRITAWEDGESFQALITSINSGETKAAGQDTMEDSYSVMVSKDMPLAAGDYMKRGNGMILRIASSPDENIVPEISRMDVKVFNAMKTVLADGGNKNGS